MSTPQIIRSSWFSPVSMKKMEGKAPAMVVQDFIKQGYEPTAESRGILATVKNYPLAYYDIPTANKQIFQRALWDRLNGDEDLQFRMKQSKSFFGEPFHQDSLEVLLPQVSHRVTDFRFADAPLLVGDVDVLDTPNGNIIYSLMQSSYVGISSRGFGTLVDADDGENQIVSSGDYVHVSWDFVGVPAVREAMATIAGYAKSSKLVEPIVRHLLASAKFTPELGELAKIIQSDNKRIVVTVPKTIKSAEGGEAPTPEAIQSFFFKFNTGGIPVAVQGDDGWYVNFPKEGVHLGPFKDQAAAEAVINQAQKGASQSLVTEAAKVVEGEDGKFYFTFGDKQYGPFASREDAQKQLEDSTQIGLFTESETPTKEGAMAAPIKSDEGPLTAEMPNEEPDLGAMEGDTGMSPEEEADRKEFDQMVLLEVANTLASTGDENVDDEAFDFGDDNDDPDPIDESKDPIKSFFNYENTKIVRKGDGYHIVNDGGADEGPFKTEEEAKAKLESLKASVDPIKSKEDGGAPSFDESEPFADIDDAGEEDDMFFPEESMGGVTVDEQAGTISVEATSSDGEPMTAELRIEDGFLVEDNVGVTDLDGDDEAGEVNSLLPGGTVDLFAECNGDVSMAVDYILDLPNATNDDSNVIDLTEDLTDDDDMGAPDTEDDSVTSAKKPAKKDDKKKPAKKEEPCAKGGKKPCKDDKKK